MPRASNYKNFENNAQLCCILKYLEFPYIFSYLFRTKARLTKYHHSHFTDEKSVNWRTC